MTSLSLGQSYDIGMSDMPLELGKCDPIKAYQYIHGLPCNLRQLHHPCIVVLSCEYGSFTVDCFPIRIASDLKGEDRRDIKI